MNSNRVKIISFEKSWNDLLNNLAKGLLFSGQYLSSGLIQSNVNRAGTCFPPSVLDIFSYTFWYGHSFAWGRSLTIWSDICTCMSLSYRSKSRYCKKKRKIHQFLIFLKVKTKGYHYSTTKTKEVADKLWLNYDSYQFRVAKFTFGKRHNAVSAVLISSCCIHLPWNILRFVLTNAHYFLVKKKI